jgi:Zinc-finger associated domain (zf-AD)/Zinc finger, C2H2 type
MLTIDTANSCRICMISTCQLESIFLTQDGRSTSEIVTEISGVNIDRNDGLSKKICEECKGKALELSAFRQLCIDSDETVRYNLFLAEQSEGECIGESQNDNEFESVNEDLEMLQLDDDEDDDDEEECFIEEDVDLKIEDNPNILEIFIDADTMDKSLDDEPERNSKHPEHEKIVVIERVDSKNRIKPKYSYDTHEDLTEKMREAHFAKEQMKKHKCPYCYKCFMFPSKVNRHIAAVHRNMNEPKKVIKKNHNCHICGKAFVSQFKVKRHMVVHDTELKTGLQKNWSKNYFLCETCNRKFHTRTTFDRHTMICSMLIKSTITRSADYEYICVICSDTFKAHDDMIDHMRGNHEQTAEHHCQLCNEFVGSLQEIVKHGKYHEENATHKCCVCKKFFPNGDEIMMHLLR